MSQTNEVTEHKALKSNLLSNKILIAGGEFESAVMDSIVDGIVGFDHNLRINLWNRTMELHYNLERTEVYGKCIAELVPELGQVKLLKEILRGESRFINQLDSALRHGLQIYLSPVKNKTGAVIGGLAILHDNTDINEALNRINRQNDELRSANEELRNEIRNRKKAEAELKAAHDELEERVKLRTAQLTRMNEELNEFAYVISHDLKAPLRGISSLTDWILSDYSDIIDEKGRQTLAMLKKSAARMDHLIKGVLNYYRQSRRSEVTEVDTNKMVSEIIEQLRPPSHINIVIKNLPVIRQESVPLYQVFQNLIDNSVHYCDKAEGKIEIGSNRESNGVKFWVKDNGKGIAKQDMDRIFRLFQTGNGTTRPDSTGIGLSVVRKIVTGMGGEISVESTEGSGSCFMFSLPDPE